MHSPAAVARAPRLASILRFDMPAAHSLSTSRILRMGNLGPGIAPLPGEKERSPCRSADHPTAPVTPIHRRLAASRAADAQQVASERPIDSTAATGLGLVGLAPRLRRGPKA